MNKISYVFLSFIFLLTLTYASFDKPLETQKINENVTVIKYPQESIVITKYAGKGSVEMIYKQN